MLQRLRHLRAGFIVIAAAMTGCQSPLDSGIDDPALEEVISTAIEYEMRELPGEPRRRQTTREPSDVERALSERREELDQLGPRFRDEASGKAVIPTLGSDLTGDEQQRVQLNLRDAVSTAVEHNLEAQIARLQPAINEADLVAAEAAFDAVFYAETDFARTDEPQTVPVIGGQPLGSNVQEGRRYRFETGVRRPLTTGGEIEFRTELTRSRNLAESIDLLPDPAYASQAGLSVNQPLLRGFGTAVNTASIRLSRNMHRRSVQELRSELLTLVADTEQAYWDLIVAWRNLVIREWLVEVGAEVRDVLEQRLEFDVRQAQYADAVATVEQRKANVLRARFQVRATSDRLKALMNDPDLPVGSEVVLRPIDEAIETPVSYDAAESIRTAVTHRPELQQAILEIDDAAIRQRVADNARLPLLDVRGEVLYFGLDQSADASYRELATGRYINYLVGLVFEVPIGNRASEADYRRARLERSAAVIGYRQTVQQIALDVKTALREVVTNYELIGATRSFRIAQAENLRALLVEEDTLAALTPAFLNLKFQRQDGLAQARLEEAEALVEYNKAISSLYRAMGTGLERNRINIDLVDPDDVVTLDRPPRHGSSR